MKSNSGLTMGFIMLGYKVYIAARFLLNNRFEWQGAILASTAIEKYMKGVLLLKGIKLHGHLNQGAKFKDAIKKTEYGFLFDNIDPVFWDMIVRVYNYRYYDEKTVTKNDTVGFLTNQFLGELDFVVHMLNKAFIIINEKGERIDTIYDRERKEERKELWQNNYVLQSIDKTEFMNRPSPAYGISVRPDELGTEYEITTKEDVVGKYEGKIWSISLELNKSGSVATG